MRLDNRLLELLKKSFNEDRSVRWRDRIIEEFHIGDLWGQSWLISEKPLSGSYRQLLLGTATPETCIDAKIIFDLADRIDRRDKDNTELKIDIRKDYALLTGLNYALRTTLSLETKGETPRLKDYGTLIANYSGVMLLALMYAPNSEVDVPDFRHAKSSWDLLSELDNENGN